jgi:hypothetical protein
MIHYCVIGFTIFHMLLGSREEDVLPVGQGSKAQVMFPVGQCSLFIPENISSHSANC